MASTTKITYTSDGTKSHIDIDGKGCELIKAVSRIAYSVENTIGMDDKEFIEVLTHGIKLAKVEERANELLSDKDLTGKLNELLDLFEELL